MLKGRIITCEQLDIIPRYAYEKGKEFVKELRVIGLFSNPVSTFDSNGRKCAVDIFGYTDFGTSITVRITGWDPEYYCKIPYGYPPQEFLRLAKDALTEECKTVKFSLNIVEGRDDRYFNFGQTASFLNISAPFDLGFTKPTILKVYDAALENVKTLAEAGEVMPGLVNTCGQIPKADLDQTIKNNYNPETIRLRAELEQFPLRMSENVSVTHYDYYLMTKSGISLVGQFKVNKYSITDDNAETKTRLFALADIRDIVSDEGQSSATIEHLMIASFDAETDNLNGKIRKISDPRYDPIITNCVTFYRGLDETPVLAVGFIYEDKPCDPMPDALLVSCKDEAQMLLAFFRLCEIFNTDILLTFNGEMFDNSYLWIRAMNVGIQDEIACIMSRYKIDIHMLADSKQKWKERYKISFNFNATYKADGMVKHNLSRFNTSQWGSFDARLFFQGRFPKLFGERGKLNDMLAHFEVQEPRGFNTSTALAITSEDGSNTMKTVAKDDLEISQMYAYWRMNDPGSTASSVQKREGIYKIIHYCIKDTICTQLLILAQGVLHDMYEKAVVSYTTLNDSMHKADGVRVLNTCTRYAYINNILFMNETPPDDYMKELPETIIGGEVKSLLPGHHIGVSASDFQSQYPAQMQGSNLDTAAKVPKVVIDNPELFGLELVYSSPITDMYGLRMRYMFRVIEGEIAFGFDQLYVVEQFWAEGRVGDAQNKRRTYYVQSPRDISGKPIVHYGLTGAMEMDLASRRSVEKKKLEAINKAIEEGLYTSDSELSKLKNDSVRLDKKQNGIKIVMNSTYGVRGSILFALCDFDTAATITWCSRQLVRYLRKCMSLRFIFVPLSAGKLLESSIDIINKYLPSDDKIECTKLDDVPQHGISQVKAETHTDVKTETHIEPKAETEAVANVSILMDCASCKRYWKMLDDPNVFYFTPYHLNALQVGCYTIDFKKYTAETIYQDTDSGYFKNDALMRHLMLINPPPEGMTENMYVINIYNKIIRACVHSGIARWPINLTFEGSFSIAYYWPQKKRYAGIKCKEDPRKKGVQVSIDFSGYNGSYFDMNAFINKAGVKATGIDVIRRNSPIYVNRGLFEFMEALLKINPPESLTELAKTILAKFIDNFELLDIDAVADIYKRNDASINMMARIISRLENEANTLMKQAEETSDPNVKQQLIDTANEKRNNIPEPFAAARVVVIKTRDHIADAHGLAEGDIASRSRLTIERINDTSLGARPITMHDLDVSHYAKRLASALANFVMSEMFPDKYDRIMSIDDDGKQSLIDLKKKVINDMKNDATLKLMSAHFVVAGLTRKAREDFKLAWDKSTLLYIKPEDVKSRHSLLNVIGQYSSDLAGGLIQTLEEQKRRIRNKSWIKAMNECKKSIGTDKTFQREYYKQVVFELHKAEDEYVGYALNLLHRMKEKDEKVCAMLKQARREGDFDLIPDSMIIKLRIDDSFDSSEPSKAIKLKKEYLEIYRRYIVVCSLLGITL